VAEAGDSLDDGGSRDSAVEEEVEDAGVDGNSVVLGSIAEIEGDFEGFAGGEHGAPFLNRSSAKIAGDARDAIMG
jgi:hypothetical protein